MAVTTVDLKRRDIRTMYQGLGMLAKKTLPNINADLKVAKLIRALRPDVEEIDAAIKKFQIANSVEAEDGGRTVTNAYAFNVAIEAEMDVVETVTLPATRITAADLPASLKGDGGEANREQLAAVIVDLGILFAFDDDEA